MTKRLREWGGAVVLGAVMVLAACNDSTGPAFRPLDPAATGADANAMRAVFESPAMRQFHAAAARTPIAAPFRGDAPIAARAWVPESWLGVTFEYDAGQNVYVPGDRTGAPADGVRFLLYGLTGANAPDPANETGFIDVIDHAPAGAATIGLEVRAVSGNTTFLEYDFTGSVADAAGDMEARGFAASAGTRVDFQTRITAPRSWDNSVSTVEFQYTIPARTFGLVGSAVQIGVPAMDGQLETAIVSSGTRLRYHFPSSESRDGTIQVNERAKATISDIGETPLILPATGATLTEAEREALELMLFAVDHAFEWSFRMLGPISWAIPWTMPH